ncbi:hypothetical protein HDU85_001979 [Gaertneriomyces sp. JEL0708]|nr:hypothetical protein HDU85_001979 [Gaertneriomyces sp. JEL0708]
MVSAQPTPSQNENDELLSYTRVLYAELDGLLDYIGEDPDLQRYHILCCVAFRLLDLVNVEDLKRNWVFVTMYLEALRQVFRGADDNRTIYNWVMKLYSMTLCIAAKQQLRVPTIAEPTFDTYKALFVQVLGRLAEFTTTECEDDDEFHFYGEIDFLRARFCNMNCNHDWKYSMASLMLFRKNMTESEGYTETIELLCDIGKKVSAALGIELLDLSLMY